MPGAPVVGAGMGGPTGVPAGGVPGEVMAGAPELGAAGAPVDGVVGVPGAGVPGAGVPGAPVGGAGAPGAGAVGVSAALGWARFAADGGLGMLVPGGTKAMVSSAPLTVRSLRGSPVTSVPFWSTRLDQVLSWTLPGIEPHLSPLVHVRCPG